MCSSVKDLRGLILNIYSRYYSFLPSSSIEEIKNRMEIIDVLIGIGDLNSASRMVQRAFYRLAKELGWKKTKKGKWIKPKEL